jgi:hypothetical protein
MRARTLFATSLAVAVAGCGGPILFAELEMPSVQVTLPQYQFPTIGISTTQTIVFDVGANVPLVNEPNVDYDLELNRMTLVLEAGGPFPNFDTFNSVRIVAVHPPLPDLVLIEYANPPPGSTTVTATSSTSADLKPYLDAGQMTVNATFEADPTTPVGVWYADVTADLYLRVRLDYGAYL